MRKALKFFHTLASCGLIGALLGYMLVLVYAPHDSPAKFADMRQTIGVLCNYLLLPSLGIALITGLLSMAVHRPFQEKRWAWVKALLGLSMFESTLAIIQSKANYAAVVAAKIASGVASADALKTTRNPPSGTPPGECNGKTLVAGSHRAGVHRSDQRRTMGHHRWRRNDGPWRRCHAR